MFKNPVFTVEDIRQRQAVLSLEFDVNVDVNLALSYGCIDFII